MSLKKTMLSIASGVVMLTPLAGVAHAGTVNCSSNKTTVVTVVNSNTTVSSQTVVQNNYTGGNVNAYNIGVSGVRSGRAVSVANLNLATGGNTTFLGLGGGSNTNNCVVVGN